MIKSVFSRSSAISYIFISLHAIAWAHAASPVVLYDSTTDTCDLNIAPDQPARAFKDEDGLVHLFTSQYNATASIGTTLLGVKEDCSIIFRSDQRKDPADYDDYSWLASFFTKDGKHVVAILHEEFHGAEQPQLCPSRNLSGCTQTALTTAVSSDGGYTFLKSTGAADLVATLPLKYQNDQKLWFGFMNPTNIIFDGRYYYFLASYITPTLINPPQPNRGGVCIFRTLAPGDPKSWRAWNGQSFSIQFKDPYLQNLPMYGNPCESIGTGKIMWSLGSLQRHVKRQLYILTMRCQTWDKGCQPGAYISTSKDLISWSSAVPLLLDAQATRDGTSELYPSLLDPAASDRNFVDTTDSPWLFTVEMRKVGNVVRRRLLAFPVHLPFDH